MHPILALAHRHLASADSSNRARPMLDAVNAQILTNWRSTSVRGGSARIPHTSFSTDGLPDFPQGEGRNVVNLFTGIRGQTGDRLNQAVEILVAEYAKARKAQREGREPRAAVEIHLFGLPTSAGGVISKEWVDDLKKNGPSVHGEAVAEILAPVLRRPLERVIFDGRSKGSRTAAYALRLFPEHAGKRQLVRDHASGDNFAQVVFGYPLDNALGKVRKFLRPDSTPDQAEREFLATNAEILAENGVTVFDDSEHWLLKWNAYVQDALHMREGRPWLPTDVKATNKAGMLDLTALSTRNVLRGVRSTLERSPRVYQDRDGELQLDNSTHSSPPFSRRAVEQMREAVRAA